MESIEFDNLTSEVLGLAALDYVGACIGGVRSEADGMNILAEILLRRHIIEELTLAFTSQAVARSAMSNRDRLYNFYIVYQKAKHGRDGYRLHKRTAKDGKTFIGKVVYITDKNGKPVMP